MFEYDSKFARFLNKWVPRLLWVAFVVGVIFGWRLSYNETTNVPGRMIYAILGGFGCWWGCGMLFLPIQMHYWALNEMTSKSILHNIVTYLLLFIVGAVLLFFGLFF